MFSVIGFLMLLVLCLYLIFLGVGSAYITYAFTGKSDLIGVVIGIVGIILFILVCCNAPFTVIGL